MAEIIPERQEYAKMLKTEHGDKVLGEIKVDQVCHSESHVKTDSSFWLTS